MDTAKKGSTREDVRRWRRRRRRQWARHPWRELRFWYRRFRVRRLVRRVYRDFIDK